MDWVCPCQETECFQQVGGGGSGEWLVRAGFLCTLLLFQAQSSSHSRPSIVTSLYIIYYSWQIQSDAKEKSKAKLCSHQWHSGAQLGWKLAGVALGPPKGVQGGERVVFRVFFPKDKRDSREGFKPEKTQISKPPNKVLVWRRYLQSNQNHKEEKRKNNMNNRNGITNKRKQRIQRTSNSSSNSNSNIEIAMTMLMTTTTFLCPCTLPAWRSRTIKWHLECC